jgi:hypothetical protein
MFGENLRNTVDDGLAPKKGLFPVSNANRFMPKAQISARGQQACRELSG